MKRATWKVVLIVEDDSDGRACCVLREKMGINVTLDWLPANGIGNIKRRGEKLLDMARARIERERGCVAVLLDRDGKEVTRDEPHRTIQRLCSRAGVPLLLAVESFEAWLLADAGCTGWLGISQPPNTDCLPQPKKELERAYEKKAGRMYTRRARRILAEHADGSARECSPSLRHALDHLANSPCASQRAAA
jgi:hypothetical protein